MAEPRFRVPRRSGRSTACRRSGRKTFVRSTQEPAAVEKIALAAPRPRTVRFGRTPRERPELASFGETIGHPSNGAVGTRRRNDRERMRAQPEVGSFGEIPSGRSRAPPLALAMTRHLQIVRNPHSTHPLRRARFRGRRDLSILDYRDSRPSHPESRGRPLCGWPSVSPFEARFFWFGRTCRPRLLSYRDLALVLQGWLSRVPRSG